MELELILTTMIQLEVITNGYKDITNGYNAGTRDHDAGTRDHDSITRSYRREKEGVGTIGLDRLLGVVLIG